jgi:hypothetical protein
MPYLTFFFKLDLFYLNFERYQVLKCIVTQTRTEKGTIFSNSGQSGIVVVQVVLKCCDVDEVLLC